MKKPGNKKLLKSNRISGFQKADHQKLPIDKTRRIISQKFHFFKIFKVGLIGALIFGILFELALEHVPGLLLWSIYGIIVTVILKEIWDIVKERYKSTDEYKNMMSSSQMLEPGGIDHSESSRNNQSELIRNSQCTCLAN